MEDNENINKNPDPDVNIQSWIFVEKVVTTNEDEPNPEFSFENETSCVQELKEDELGINESSCDSDGISVISETETEEVLRDYCSCLPKINIIPDEDLDFNNDIPYFEANTDFNKSSLESNESDINTIMTSNYFEEPIENKSKQLNLKLTFATTVAGVCILITYLLSNYNNDAPKYVTDQVLDDRPNTDITFDDDIFDEIYDKHMWTNFEINNTCDFNIDLAELNTNINNVNNLAQSYKYIKSDISLPVLLKPTNLQQSNIDSQSGTKNKKTIYQNVNKNYNDEKYANNQDKDISYNFNSNKNKKYKSKNKNSNKFSSQSTETQTLKLKENYLNKKDKYLTQKEKYLKKLEKHVTHLESKLRKIQQRIKKNLPRNKSKRNKNYYKKSNTHNTTGEWYENMYFGRSEIRQKEKLSDWIFDRSKMRSKLRDRAHWYFSRANSREEIRSSENLRSGKRKGYKSYRY